MKLDLLKWIRPLLPSVREHKRVLEESRITRTLADLKIKQMRADLNGCGDEWFLVPRQSLDDCLPRD